MKYHACHKLGYVCHAQDRSSDEVRSGCMALLASIARGGGSALWRDGGYYYEEGARLAALLLDDASLVRAEADSIFSDCVWLVA